MKINDKIFSKKLFFVFYFTLQISFLLAAPMIDQVFDDVSRSIVKVSSEDLGKVGTGFCWEGYIVTALHVVDGSSNIKIYSEYLKDLIPVTVFKVLKEKDLVLLKLSRSDSSLPKIKISTEKVKTNNIYNALGYRLSIDAIKNIELKVLYGDNVLGNNINKQIEQSLLENGYPSPKINIISFNGHLLPGISGAPIVNDNGEVIAISDGGLENGAASISWGIPINDLGELRNSTNNVLPNSKYLSSFGRPLFSADIVNNSSGKNENNNVSLLKIRVRSLTELIYSTDDPVGLSQLLNIVPGLYQSPDEILFDIYQDLESGANIVLPVNAKIRNNNGIWDVETNNERFSSYIRFEKLNNPLDAQVHSLNFDLLFGPKSVQEKLQIDPSWSYFSPKQRNDGMVVTRKALYVIKQDQFQHWIPNKYIFETFVLRGNYLLSYNIIDNAAYLPRNIDDQSAWKKAVLAIHLSNFSY